MLPVLLLALATSATLVSGGPSVVDHYLLEYFDTYPSRATRAGWPALDSRLEDLDAARRNSWIEFNRTTVHTALRELGRDGITLDDRLDLELLLRRARTEIFDYESLQRPRRDPLYWTGILTGATTFLLVREDAPRQDRMRHALDRCEAMPRLVEQALLALAASQPAERSAEIWRLAAAQVEASINFYRGGFLGATLSPPPLDEQLSKAAGRTAQALDKFAAFLTEGAAAATGSPRLGALYEERFRLVTGIETPLNELLAEAQAALTSKRQELIEYATRHWREMLPGQPVPQQPDELIRTLFARLSEDRADDMDAFVADYRQLVERSVAFVRQHDLVTLPEPLTLHIDRSPAHFLGASVGGVYAAGPFAPEAAKTLLFLPTPHPQATAEQLGAFFRDFNHHFNVMITPHEVIPGHYLQLKWAARHPHKVRALFGDGVYIEGWGTFCERLMLDQGWGEPLDRVAHLKKQLENIARTLVDIRVHTTEMSREEVLDLVRNQAFQDEQFAANMWRRALTSSPQLVSYFLGYREVHGLYLEAKALRGDEFSIKQFMDEMMRLGPVPIHYYRQQLKDAVRAEGSDDAGTGENMD